MTKRVLSFLIGMAVLLLAGLGVGIALAKGPARASDAGPLQIERAVGAPDEPDGPGVVSPIGIGTAAACTGGAPTVEGGVILSNCYTHNFTVNGNARSISVWYTTVVTTVTAGGKTYRHYVANQAQAQAVAQAADQAWQRFFTDSGHEPYLTGCGNNLNIQLRDGKLWDGIAYWASSGSCRIGIDAPMINDGVGNSDRRVVAHEVQHYLHSTRTTMAAMPICNPSILETQSMWKGMRTWA